MTDDLISRQAAIDALKRKTFRLTFAEEQNCEGHVAWSADAVYSDVMEGELLELPSAQPERETGHWILYDNRFPWSKDYKCSECGNYINLSSLNAGRGDANYCPNCGAKMINEDFSGQKKGDKSE